MTKIKYIFCAIIIVLTACKRNSSVDISSDDVYKYSEEDIVVYFTPFQTKGIDENKRTFKMDAVDAVSDIHLTSIVTSTTIASSYTRLEQYTDNGLFVGSLLIHEDKIVQVQYNEEIDDADLGAPVTKGGFFKCVAEKYKTLSDIIESDGETMLLCDGLDIVFLCNLSKVVSSAIICMRDGK